MGRPTKRTPELIESMVRAAEAGASLSAIADMHGVTYQTLAMWRRNDPALELRLNQARGKAEARITETVLAAAEKDWRAGLAWLERQRRAEWGPTQRVDVDITSGGQPLPPREIDFARLTPEQRRSLYLALGEQEQEALAAGESE